MKKIIFFEFFSVKYGKMWKKVENDEKGSYIAEKGPIDQKWKNNIFWIFSGKYGKMSKKLKMMKKGHMMLQKAQIDKKWKK